MNQRPVMNLRAFPLAIAVSLLMWFGLYKLWCWTFAWLETLR